MAEVREPSKEKIITIMRAYKEKLSERRSKRSSGKGYDPLLIDFHKAQWRLDDVEIRLDSFDIYVYCSKNVPDYINRMRAELENTTIRYKIEQTSTFR